MCIAAQESVGVQCSSPLQIAFYHSQDPKTCMLIKTAFNDTSVSHREALAQERAELDHQKVFWQQERERAEDERKAWEMIELQLEHERAAQERERKELDQGYEMLHHQRVEWETEKNTRLEQEKATLERKWEKLMSERLAWELECSEKDREADRERERARKQKEMEDRNRTGERGDAGVQRRLDAICQEARDLMVKAKEVDQRQLEAEQRHADADFTQELLAVIAEEAGRNLEALEMLDAMEEANCPADSIFWEQKRIVWELQRLEKDGEADRERERAWKQDETEDGNRTVDERLKRERGNAEVQRRLDKICQEANNLIVKAKEVDQRRIEAEKRHSDAVFLQELLAVAESAMREKELIQREARINKVEGSLKKQDKNCKLLEMLDAMEDANHLANSILWEQKRVVQPLERERGQIEADIPKKSAFGPNLATATTSEESAKGKSTQTHISENPPVRPTTEAKTKLGGKQKVANVGEDEEDDMLRRRRKMQRQDSEFDCHDKGGIRRQTQEKASSSSLPVSEPNPSRLTGRFWSALPTEANRRSRHPVPPPRSSTASSASAAPQVPGTPQSSRTRSHAPLFDVAHGLQQEIPWQPRTRSKRELVATFQRSEMMWKELSSMNSLWWADFPWPVFGRPSTPDDIHPLVIKEYISSFYHLHSARSVRECVLVYIWRWHHNRFGSRFLHKVVDDDKERVQEAADIVMKGLIRLLPKA
ncbi:hypothetical protein FA15DRAFT_659591 [Coprinopsis marcescibilis]|uniref:Uncharacterized protein n=1 Tax=Coprinopsis marcescibilis TaxID=230819 RepID=A0A5C3KI18_COPMA|nr:hypothetical protein FA15DRAFT_659591 [Coprinopsis marcescibilis]